MPNPAPIVTVRGRVHGSKPTTTQVPARPAQAAGRDEEGTFRRAQPARPAYEYESFTIATIEGGFVTVDVMPQAVEDAASMWTVPSRDELVEWPVRPYVGWAGRDGSRYRVPAFSLAGDVLAERFHAAKDAAEKPPTRLASTGS